MNCRPGDLAIVVWSLRGNEGKIVRCISYLGLFKMTDGGSAHLWLTDHDFGPQDPLEPAWSRYAMADDQLRPIRDPGDGARDETLNWLPTPTTEAA